MNLYIHVPFCAQRCSYCDFYTQTRLALRARYVEALLREMELRRRELPEGECLEHIYLGGGTPSLLSPEDLERIFTRLGELYPISPTGERTIECNPDDITPEYAEALARLGLWRVSMGVQSFQHEDLTFLNRRHTRDQVYRAVEMLRAVGITELSLDLIYGLPGQTLETWADNVARILALGIPHISAYHLIYEEGTPLTRLRDKGVVSEVSEDDSLAFFTYLITELRGAGYEHYEVSNFALPGHYARLNTGYWQGDTYIGLGPSAHSFDGAVRRHNVASIDRYAEALLERGECPLESEPLSETDLRHEYIMTRLRTQWGIDLADYEARFSTEARVRLLSACAPHLSAGRVEVHEGVLRLTDEGIFVSDGILLDLFD